MYTAISALCCSFNYITRLHISSVNIYLLNGHSCDMLDVSSVRKDTYSYSFISTPYLMYVKVKVYHRSPDPLNPGIDIYFAKLKLDQFQNRPMIIVISSSNFLQ